MEHMVQLPTYEKIEFEVNLTNMAKSIQENMNESARIFLENMVDQRMQAKLKSCGVLRKKANYIDSGLQQVQEKENCNHSRSKYLKERHVGTTPELREEIPI